MLVGDTLESRGRVEVLRLSRFDLASELIYSSAETSSITRIR